MKNALAQIAVGTIILAGFCAGMSEYPADNFFGNIPKCLFLSTGLLVAAKSFVFAKRSLSKRFKFSTVTKAAGIVLVIILAFLYLFALGIIASKIWPNHNRNRNTKYDNKFVILDETNPRDPQFKLYDNASKFVSAVNSKDIQLKGWLLVFTSPTQRIETVGADTFINAWLTDDEKKRNTYEAIAYSQADKLFRNGYVCSTFPDAKSVDDIFDSVLIVIREIVKQKQQQ